MTDIHIRRCTLRIVRQGGWSWGPRPRRILRGAVEALPRLIEHELGSLLADYDDVALETPVRVRVPLRLADLERASTLGSVDLIDLPVAGLLRRALEGPILSAVEEAKAREKPGPPIEEPPPAALEPTGTGALLARLIEWAEAGTLPALLATVGPATLARIHEALLPLRTAPPTRESPEIVDEIVHRLRDRVPLTLPADRDGRLRLRIALAVEAAREVRIGLPDPSVSVFVESAIPLERGAVTRGRATPGEPARQDVSEPSVSDRAEPVSESQWTPRVDGEVHIPSVLPFLILGPLSRCGFFRTLGWALDRQGLRDMAPCFGALLAYQLSEPPRRGWQRGPPDDLAAAAVAGLAEPVPGATLERFARLLEPHLDLPDADLAHAALVARHRDEPIVLVQVPEGAGGGITLFDPSGLVPVTWVAEGEIPAPVLFAARLPVTVVPESSAQRETLARLDKASFRFVTRARPTRGETWTPLPGSARGRWWSNREGRLSPRSREVLAGIDDLAERAEAVVDQLYVRRRALPVATVTGTGRTVTLAAALALGGIAWRLWREREPVDPVLALERFDDLDARVGFSPERIRVKVPLGARHSDLLDSGFLTAIHDVPWLGGRTVEISGG